MILKSERKRESFYCTFENERADEDAIIHIDETRKNDHIIRHVCSFVGTKLSKYHIIFWEAHRIFL